MAKLTDKQELFAHPDDVYVGECVIYTGYIISEGMGRSTFHESRTTHIESHTAKLTEFR